LKNIFATMPNTCLSPSAARPEYVKALWKWPASKASEWDFSGHYPFPFPTRIIQAMLPQLKGIMSVELSAGQMVEDIRLAVNGAIPVEFFGKMGGIVFSPEEILNAFTAKFNL
jgi:hypothetical protein